MDHYTHLSTYQSEYLENIFVFPNHVNRAIIGDENSLDPPIHKLQHFFL